MSEPIQTNEEDVVEVGYRCGYNDAKNWSKFDPKAECIYYLTDYTNGWNKGVEDRQKNPLCSCKRTKSSNILASDCEICKEK